MIGLPPTPRTPCKLWRTLSTPFSTREHLAAVRVKLGPLPSHGGCVDCRDLGDCLHRGGDVSAAERRQVGFIFKYGVENYHGVCETSLDVLREEKFYSLEVADALRLAIIAALDAISLYLQLARCVDDERVRKVFEDVAREEKAHFGEFLALLKMCDLGLEAELNAGAEGVR